MKSKDSYKIPTVFVGLEDELRTPLDLYKSQNSLTADYMDIRLPWVSARIKAVEEHF